MGKSLLIRGGHVIDPASGVDAIADVLLRDGKVAAVGKVSEKADEVLDAKGLIVAPGFIDFDGNASCCRWRIHICLCNAQHRAGERFR
jgi:predicted amidohydrolase